MSQKLGGRQHGAEDEQIPHRKAGSPWGAGPGLAAQRPEGSASGGAAATGSGLWDPLSDQPSRGGELVGDPLAERPEEAAVRRAIAGGAGTPLPPWAAELFGAAYETHLGDVRLHQDHATMQAASAASAAAFSYGRDVFLGAGAGPSDPDGLFILAHELAHVAQHHGAASPGRPVLGGTDESHEQAADQAAHAALSGRRSALEPAPHRVRFFRPGRDNDPRDRSGHAPMTTDTLRGMGLTRRQAHQAELGNWERDFSQIVNFAPDLLPVLQILALERFGRGLDPSSLGTYDPVEHIDNPTGLRGSDVYAQGPMQGSGSNPDTAGSHQDAGRGDQAYADVDRRYHNTPTHGRIMNPGDAAAYQVDETGLPRYINTSKIWIKQTLHEAAQLGRGVNAGGGGQLRGPQLFASALHPLQDYYAHSNFLEVAINLLIREGTLQIGGQQVARTQSLDTKVHGNDPRTGEPRAENLRHQGREVMCTGSFVRMDTVASIAEELKDTLVHFNPFRGNSREPSKVVDAVLDYLDMTTPSDFSGLYQRLGDLIHPAVEASQHLSSVSEAAADLARRLAEYEQQLRGKQHGLKGVYHWLYQHSPLRLLKSHARGIPVVGPRVVAAIESAERKIDQLIEQQLGGAWNRQVTRTLTQLNRVIGQMRRHSNVNQLRHMGQGPGLLGRAERYIGGVGDMYDPRTGQPRNGIAAGSYTPPTHTEVAKDHPEQGGNHGDGEMGWLNPLAEQLAARASQAVARPVSRCWDIRDRSGALQSNDLAAIDAVVDHHLAHPADCRDTWEDLVRRNVARPPLSAHLLQRLASRVGP